MLVESKWVESGLPASELFSFIGKIEGKFTGTIGLFVSRTPLSDNFLRALRLGRRQSVMVIHGKDVDFMFDPQFPLEEYLKVQLEYLSHQNLPHYPAERFLAERKTIEQVVNEAKAGPADKVTGLIEECISLQHAKNLAHERAAGLTLEEVVSAVIQLIDKRGPMARFAGSKEDAWRSDNLKRFLHEVSLRLPRQRTDADRLFFMDRLSTDFQDSEYIPFLHELANRLSVLTADERQQFETRLEKQWDDAFQNYDAENRMSMPTSLVWPYLSPQTRVAILRYFIAFLLSDRQQWRPQFTFARNVISDATGNAALRGEVEQAFDAFIQDAAHRMIDADWMDDAGRELLARRLIRQSHPMEPFIQNREQRIHAIVRKEQEAFAAKQKAQNKSGGTGK